MNFNQPTGEDPIDAAFDSPAPSPETPLSLARNAVGDAIDALQQDQPGSNALLGNANVALKRAEESNTQRSGLFGRKRAAEDPTIAEDIARMRQLLTQAASSAESRATEKRMDGML